MSDVEKLLQGYSHPVTRAQMGQAKWDQIRNILMNRAREEGIDLPPYFEEEEVMDLNRANAEAAHEDNMWMPS